MFNKPKNKIQNTNKHKGLSNIGSRKLIARPKIIIDESLFLNNLNNPNEIKEIMVPKNSEFDINSNNFLVVEYENFEDLKKHIKNNYKKFDTVLFSCGGSSFSNFKNYMERGEYFKKMIVGEIN